MLQEIATLKKLSTVYDEEISKKVKNKRKLYKFDSFKMQYLINIKYVLRKGYYDGGKYNVFIIKRPKVRLIMSQNIYDKVINHLIAREILEVKLTRFLDIRNTATRKKMGTSYAIELLKKYLEVNKRHQNIYVLKMDIKKYFNSIDHMILKKLIQPYLAEDEFKLLSVVIDSTDKEYINRKITEYNTRHGYDLPLYEKGKGLPIGNMTSQFLAIFYLHKLHYYIIHTLKLKYMIVYMDDYIIIHHDKKYLQECLDRIESILYNEYKLKLNSKKTMIRNIKYGIEFLGYVFKVENNKTIIKLSQKNKVKINREIKNLRKNNQDFSYVFSKLMNYKYSYKCLSNEYVKNILLKYW